MKTEKELINKYRKVIYQETENWIMPSVSINHEPSAHSILLVLSANKNLETYGRTMSASLVEKLVSLPEDELIKECQELMAAVKESSQSELFQDAVVFYPDFPYQVMALSDVERYLYQLLEYAGVSLFGTSLRPEFEATERYPLLEGFERDLKVIDQKEFDFVHDLMKERMFSAATLSKPKMNTLLEYMHDTVKWFSWIYQQTIPNRENKAAIAVDITKNKNLSEKAKNAMLHRLISSATDVLRLASELSNGKTHTVKQKQRVLVWDKNHKSETKRIEWRTKRVSEEIVNTPGLSGKVYFKLSRSEARLTNQLLNDVPDLYTAIWLRKDLFKTYSKSITADSSFPRLQAAYQNLYTNTKVNEHGVPIVSPYSAVQKALDAVRSGAEEALILTQKVAHDFPGVFNRHFIQFAIAGINHDSLQQICDIYAENGYKAPIKEQLKLYNLVSLYENGLPYRAIHIAKNNCFIKEETTYSFAAEQAQMIKDGIKVSVLNALQTHEPLGNIYVDPDIVDIMLPENGERSSSKGSVLTSGSVLKGNQECNIIRQFIGWENQDGKRIDIDTSASFYNKDLDEVAACSYYSSDATVNGMDIIAIHGGDIVDAPVFSAEYMDIDKQKCLEFGIKYIVLSVNVYNDIPFDKIDVAKFGFMQRQGELDTNIRESDLKWNDFNGEIFEPSTVESLIDLNSSSTTMIPVIYDVEKDEFIWIDKPLSHAYGIQNIENKVYQDARKALIHRYTNNYSPSFGDLIGSYLYAGKAVEVTDPSEADMIFTAHPDKYIATDNRSLPLKEDARIVSAYDIDFVASELMAEKELTPESSVVSDLGFEEKENDDYDIGEILD